MRLKVKFRELEQSFKVKFGEVNNVTDGGYERGYAEGVASKQVEIDAIDTSLDGILAIQEELMYTVVTIYIDVDDTAYLPFKAIEGTTWSEWCNSKYNTIGAYIRDGVVYVGDRTISLYGSTVYDDNTIYADGYYEVGWQEQLSIQTYDIPEKPSVTDKLTEIAENEPKVYNNGYNEGVEFGNEQGYNNGYNEGKLDGYNDGYNDGFHGGYNEGYEKGKSDVDTTAVYEQGVTDGKQAEYDRFWDTLQQNGTRVNYLGAYCGAGWTNENFKPKYPINVGKVNGTQMFWHHNAGKNPYDFAQHCRENNIIIDFSIFTNLYNAFAYAYITTVGEIDFKSIAASSSYNWNGIFTGARIVTMEKLVFYETNPEFVTNMFQNCTELENITVEGVIAKNGLNLQWSTKLSHDSLVSIINCLQDKTSDTSGTEWVVTIGATNYAKLTEEDKANITAKGWDFR